MPALVEIRVSGLQELIANLENLPARMRLAVFEKMTQEVRIIKEKLLAGMPGKYFDPAFLHDGTDQLTKNMVVGFIEPEQKEGTYTIYPTKANFLRFFAKDGNLVFAKIVHHPFPKVEIVGHHLQLMLEGEVERIQSDFEDAVIEAL